MLQTPARGRQDYPSVNSIVPCRLAEAQKVRRAAGDISDCPERAVPERGNPTRSLVGAPGVLRQPGPVCG